MDISDPKEIRAMNLMIRMQVRYTPDFPVLLESPGHLFFIVNDFQTGCHNNVELGKSKFGCRAYTHDGFECFREILTDKVIPFYERRVPELVDKMHFARLKGEVFQVPTKQIPMLDTAMRNGVQFKRRRIQLLVPDKSHQLEDNFWHKHVVGAPRFKHIVSDERVIILRAYVYEAVRDYWNPIIDALHYDRLEMHDSPRPWLRRYYQFNKRRNE